jgi:hypothetical protein
MLNGTMGGLARPATPVSPQLIDVPRQGGGCVPTTVAILPTFFGGGDDIYRVQRSGCPTLVGSGITAVEDWNGTFGNLYGVGILALATDYIALYNNFDEVSEHGAVYYCSPTGLAVTHSSGFTGDVTDSSLGLGPVIFDNGPNVFFMVFDGAGPTPPVNLYKGTVASDFSTIDSSLLWVTGFSDTGSSQFWMMGYNPYHDLLYVKQNRIFSPLIAIAPDTGVAVAVTEGVNGGGDMPAFTPDGAVWFTRAEFDGDGLYRWHPDDGLSSLNALDVVSGGVVDTSGTPVPFSDNHVSFNFGSPRVLYDVFPDMTFAPSACAPNAGTARVATRSCTPPVRPPLEELWYDYTLLFVLKGSTTIAPSITVPGFTVFDGLGLGDADISFFLRKETTQQVPVAFSPDLQSASGAGASVPLAGPNGTAPISVTWSGFPDSSVSYTVVAVHVVGHPKALFSGGPTPSKGSGSVGPALSPVAIPTFQGTGSVLVIAATDTGGAGSANISVAAVDAAAQSVEGGTGLPVHESTNYLGSMSLVYEVPPVSDPGFQMSASGAADFHTGNWWTIGFQNL